MGIGLGYQLMALAAGADTFKLKYGHRSHNQPVKQMNGNISFITAQNHGFAINTDTLNDEWEPYYVNLNDGTNEGIRHKTKPFFAVQFYPDVSAGANDSGNVFGMFVEEVKKFKASGHS
jgi:carbamoyl-phosphate synthase small subunit